MGTTSASTSSYRKNQYKIPESDLDIYASSMFEKSKDLEYVCLCNGNTNNSLQTILKILKSKGLPFRTIFDFDENKCILMEASNMKIKIIPWIPLKHVHGQHIPQQCFMQIIRIDPNNVVSDFKEIYLSIIQS